MIPFSESEGQSNRFARAKLFSIRLLHPNTFRPYWRTIYVRCANASILYFLCFEISWRRSYLPHVAYSSGWGAGFMAGRREGK